MTTRRSSCNYITGTWMTLEHQSGCNEPTCPGCRPCEHDHCAMRGQCSNHVEHATGIITCPSCIGRTRRDIKDIVRLVTYDLEAEVLDAGVNSEAMTLIGAATIALPIDSRRGWCQYPARESHPYTILAGWELTLREDYGPTTELTITIPRAADYLDGLLNGTFPHERRFEDFAREIRRCKTHLEAVIHDSQKPETGAPCPECGDKAPRLVRRYPKTSRIGAGTITDDSLDTWHCPNDGAHWWTQADYQLRIAATYLDHSPWLTADQLNNLIGVPAGTVRRWANDIPTGHNKPRVAKGGYNGQRQQLYSVEDTRREWLARTQGGRVS